MDSVWLTVIVDLWILRKKKTTLLILHNYIFTFDKKGCYNWSLIILFSCRIRKIKNQFLWLSFLLCYKVFPWWVNWFDYVTIFHLSFAVCKSMQFFACFSATHLRWFSSTSRKRDRLRLTSAPFSIMALCHDSIFVADTSLRCTWNLFLNESDQCPNPCV